MRIFETPLAPQSGLGRVIFGVLVAVLATAALLAWTPANADDAEARRAESPYFHVAGSDASVDRLPLKSHPGRRAHRRRDRRRDRDAALPQRRPARDRGAATSSPARRTRGGVRDERAPRRPPDHRADPREAAGAHRIRGGEAGGQDRRAARAAPAQRVPDERRQHPARRRRRGRAALHRAAGAARRGTTGSSFRPWSARATTARRRSRPPASSGSRTPHLPAGDAEPAAFDLKVHARHAAAGEGDRSASHASRCASTAATAARPTVALNAPAIAGNDRDFILDYRLAGDRIETGPDAVPRRPERELLPRAGRAAEGDAAPAQINPRDYIFVVDISGSMHGFPLDTAKALLRAADRRPAPERHLQRDAVLRQQPDAGAALGAGHPRQHRPRHRRPSSRWAAAAAPRSCRRCAASPRCRRRPTCRAA